MPSGQSRCNNWRNALSNSAALAGPIRSREHPFRECMDSICSSIDCVNETGGVLSRPGSVNRPRDQLVYENVGFKLLIRRIFRDEPHHLRVPRQAAIAARARLTPESRRERGLGRVAETQCSNPSSANSQPRRQACKTHRIGHLPLARTHLIRQSAAPRCCAILSMLADGSIASTCPHLSTSPKVTLPVPLPNSRIRRGPVRAAYAAARRSSQDMGPRMVGCRDAFILELCTVLGSKMCGFGIMALSGTAEMYDVRPVLLSEANVLGLSNEDHFFELFNAFFAGSSATARPDPRSPRNETSIVLRTSSGRSGKSFSLRSAR